MCHELSDIKYLPQFQVPPRFSDTKKLSSKYGRNQREDSTAKKRIRGTSTKNKNLLIFETQHTTQQHNNTTSHDRILAIQKQQEITKQERVKVT